MLRYLRHAVLLLAGLNAALAALFFFFTCLADHDAAFEKRAPVHCDPWPTAPWTILAPGPIVGCAAAKALRYWGRGQP